MNIFQSLLPIFAQTILPVALVALAGFGLASYLPMDTQSIGRLIFYLATPALVFRSLYQMTIDYSALRQMVYVAVGVVIMTALLGWLAGFDQDRRKRAAIVLTSSVSNNGNMGIPISYFAFGDIGLALGSIYYVIMSSLSNTIGVAIASAGRASVGAALLNSLKVPMLYAATAGLALNWLGTELPTSLFRAIDLLAGAAIPGMLVLLGVQLRAAPLFERQAVILRSSAIRLAIGPLIAWAFCWLLGVSGVTRNVLILQAAMPTAVMVAVLATEYDTAPRLVASTIFLSTTISMVTLSLVLWLIL